jgi:hypothetical protein
VSRSWRGLAGAVGLTRARRTGRQTGEALERRGVGKPVGAVTWSPSAQPAAGSPSAAATPGRLRARPGGIHPHVAFRRRTLPPPAAIQRRGPPDTCPIRHLTSPCGKRRSASCVRVSYAVSIRVRQGVNGATSSPKLEATFEGTHRDPGALLVSGVAGLIAVAQRSPFLEVPVDNSRTGPLEAQCFAQPVSIPRASSSLRSLGRCCR